LPEPNPKTVPEVKDVELVEHKVEPAAKQAD
jgi:hypothetical protein